MVFVFIEILFKILLFKGGVLIYAEHCISNIFIVQAAGEEVLLGLHFSMGTVWADAALFGQKVLVISGRLYSQSMVAQSVPRHLLS